MHKDLRAAGLLPTLDAPHHLRSSEWAAYREAVVLATADAGSICDVGLPQVCLATCINLCAPAIKPSGAQ